MLVFMQILHTVHEENYGIKQENISEEQKAV